MRIILFLFFILFLGCSNNFNKYEYNSNINFSDDLSFKELKLKLEEYAELSSYPNLNE